MDLSSFQILHVPPTIFYIPNFITPEEEADILRNVYAAPKPKWTCLSKRRLQNYGGVPHEKGMIPEPIPSWLKKYLNEVDELNVFEGHKPNQVLVNEYLPGQGIMPHSDGPLYFPIVSTITCGSHTVLQFLENNETRKEVCKMLLERCSLVIIKNDMYTKYLHSIDEIDCDILDEGCVNLPNCGKQYKLGDKIVRDTRVSVTIRNVPKVLKIKLWK